MSVDELPEPETPRRRPRNRRKAWSFRLTPAGLLILLLLNLAILGILAYPFLHLRFAGKLPEQLPAWLAPVFTKQVEALATITVTPTASPSVTPSSTATLALATENPATPAPSPTPLAFLKDGLMILSLTEGNHAHLFAYQPQISEASLGLSLTRLTEGPWDDIQPVFNPDGTQLAFVSNRNGYWDIYNLELATGLVSRLTDTPEYDGAVTWSPDGLWIAYESYVDENLEIFIRSIDAGQSPIRLTANPAADEAPDWSPDGRHIAFISTRGGNPDVWLANLDQADESLFINISQDAAGFESHPGWSPDGKTLAWASVVNGFHKIYLWEQAQPEEAPKAIGSGDWPAWSPSGEVILSALFAPDQHYLTAYPVQVPGVVLPPLELPGFVLGIDWADISSPLPLEEFYKQASQVTPTPLWSPALTPAPDLPPGRYGVVELEDVTAPHPYLHDLVDEAFQALRQQVSVELGWDFLSALDNAFVPLTTPLDPGMAGDWLYTGRAFQVITIPLSAGWMAVAREDFGDQTYWRVYLRARFQDGSAGIPLHLQTWDFSTRYSGDTTAYEMGGSMNPAVLPGYWVDFTLIAADYGWERLPALPIWKSSYPASRFNEFTFSENLDWRAAMLEVVPPEALITPSPVVPPTRTLTPTPRWYQSPTPTYTATFRPTFTPVLSTGTPTVPATRTPPPSATRRASLTPSPTGNPAASATQTPGTRTPTFTPTP